jgi:hypothetical protein
MRVPVRSSITYASSQESLAAPHGPHRAPR